MLLNYLKLSFRLMARSPFFTLINVFGLGIGFASFFALWDYSTNELRADQYHKDFERIARIGMYWKWTDDGKNNHYHTAKSSCFLRQLVGAPWRKPSHNTSKGGGLFKSYS